MEHIAFAALILWTASIIVCLHGSLQAERQRSARWNEVWFEANARYQRAREDIKILRAAAFERERDLNALARAQVELRAPDCLGSTIVVTTTLQQWRLIEDIMGKEARIQRRPELEMRA